MKAQAKLAHAVKMLSYTADDVIKKSGPPKSESQLQAMQAEVLGKLEFPASQRAYVSNLVANYVMEQTQTAFEGVPRFALFSGLLGGRFRVDMLHNARSDILRNLKKSWGGKMEMKNRDVMSNGMEHGKWNSWTTPNPYSAKSAEAYAERQAAERDQVYAGTGIVEDLKSTPPLNVQLSVSKLVGGAKEFPFMSALPTLVRALTTQGVNRGIINERARLSKERPDVAASAVKAVPLSKEIDAVLALVEDRFDLSPRLYKLPKEGSSSLFDRAVLDARAHIADNEPPEKGPGAKARRDKRVFVASLLLLGERLGSAMVDVGSAPAKKGADPYELVAAHAYS